jgi:hypothetical protein
MRSALQKIARAVAAGWTADMRFGPCRYLKERRLWLRAKKRQAKSGASYRMETGGA